jgi:hypothetical protein
LPRIRTILLDSVRKGEEGKSRREMGNGRGKERKREDTGGKYRRNIEKIEKEEDDGD